MIKTQKFSLRKYKVGVASVLVGLGVVGGLAATSTEAHAAEETTPTVSPEKSEEVTEAQLIAADKAVSDAKNDLKNQEDVVAKKEAEKNKKAEEVKNLEKDINEAGSLTKEKVDKEKQEAQDAKNVADAKDAEAKRLAAEAKLKEEAARNAEKTAAEKEKAQKDAEAKEKDTKKTLEDAKNLLGDQTKAIAITQKQIADLEKAINERVNEKALKEKELAAAKLSGEALKKEQAKASADKAVAEAEKAQKEAELKAKKAQLDALKASLAQLEKQINDAQSTNAYPKGPVANLIDSSSRGSDAIEAEGELVDPDVQAILTELNRIRKEAVDLGYVNKYVPLKWSKELEQAAQTRAVEATINLDHDRPNGKRFYTVTDGKNVQTERENLAWNTDIMSSIKSWYDEKKYYDKDKNTGDAGHYLNIINPALTHTAIAGFKAKNPGQPKYPNAFAQEFTFDNKGTSEWKLDNYGRGTALVEQNLTNLFDVRAEKASVTLKLGEATSLKVLAKRNSIGANNEKLEAPVVLGNDLPWTSADSSVAKINDRGYVVGAKVGTTTVSTVVSGKTVTITVKVEATQKVQETVNQLEKLKKQQEDQKQTLEAEVKTKEQELVTISQKINSLNTILGKTPVSEKELQNRINVLDAELKTGRTALKELQAKLGNLTKSENDKKAEIAKAQADYDNAVSELKKAQTDYQAAKKANETAKADYEKAKAAATKAADEANKARETAEQLQKLYERHNKLLTDLPAVKAELKKAQADLEKLTKELADEQANYAAKAAKLKELEAKFAELLAKFTEQINKNAKVEEIPFATKKIEDATLAQGKRELRVRGVVGKKVNKLVPRVEDGKVVIATKEEVLSSPVDQVIAVGTKAASKPVEHREGENGSNTTNDEQAPANKPAGEVAANRTEERGAALESKKAGKSLPNTSAATNEALAVAGLAAIAIAARLRRKEK